MPDIVTDWLWILDGCEVSAPNLRTLKAHPEFLHHFDKPTCETLLRKVRASLAPGGKVYTLEFVPNEDRVSPPAAAAFAVIMLASTPAGDAYTFDDLQGMFANLALVGQITGHEGEAEKLVKDLQKRVDAVTDKLANVAGKPLVYYELDSTDPNAPWTAGPGSFVDALIGMAGGRNVASALSSAWAQISVEELIRQNPQVILLGNAYWGGVTAADVLARPGWGTIEAVKNQQIFPFDDNLVSRPGPRLVDGLEALARQFHPDLFE